MQSRLTTKLLAMVAVLAISPNCYGQMNHASQKVEKAANSLGAIFRLASTQDVIVGDDAAPSEDGPEEDVPMEENVDVVPSTDYSAAADGGGMQTGHTPIYSNGVVVGSCPPGFTCNPNGAIASTGIPMNTGFAQSYPMDTGFQQFYPSDMGFQQSYPIDNGFSQTYPISTGVSQSFPSAMGFSQSFPSNNGFQQSFSSDMGFSQPFQGDTGFSQAMPSMPSSGFELAGLSPSGNLSSGQSDFGGATVMDGGYSSNSGFDLAGLASSGNLSSGQSSLGGPVQTSFTPSALPAPPRAVPNAGFDLAGLRPSSSLSSGQSDLGGAGNMDGGASYGGSATGGAALAPVQTPTSLRRRVIPQRGSVQQQCPSQERGCSQPIRSILRKLRCRNCP